MDTIRDYLIRLTAAAFFCAIATGVVGGKGTLGRTVKLLCGIFMLFTIVSPWTELKLDSFTEYLDDLTSEAGAITQDGENLSRDSMANIIKAETQAYILDKAEAFGAQLTVEVDLDDSDIPVPSQVRISGSISPYGRSQLEKIISEDLGIALEDQEWIS